MLPVYDAIQLKNVIPEQSGHNKPWVVFANTETGLESFVVKLFDEATDHINHFITNEVISSILATEFDFPTPKPVLINLDESFTLYCSQDEIDQLERTNGKPQFATKMIESAPIANINLPKRIYQKVAVLDSVYAFDNLIRNEDRSPFKPNMLLKKDELFLIDHEYAFSNIDFTDINNITLQDKYTKHHFFYKHLKRARMQTKSNYFEDFSFYMRSLNLNRLDPYFNQLEQLGVNTNRIAITKWLTLVKNNLPIFVSKLKASLNNA